MPIPQKRIRIDLANAKPTVLTPESLKAELKNIGLDCKDTSLPRLERFIKEVDGALPNGIVQSYAILKPAAKKENRLEGFELDWETASTGNWTVKDFGYRTELEFIQVKDHFDWLVANRPGFLGRLDEEKYIRRYESVDSIKNFFADVTTSASASVIKGVNKETLNAAMHNAIDKLDDNQAKDYDKKDSRTIMLVDNYHETVDGKGEADAIGVLTIEWHLIIKDYQVKKEALKHDTELTVSIRAVLYDNLDIMAADLRALKAHFGGGGTLGFYAIPPKDNSVKIYTALPPADHDTFIHSLPVVNKADYLESIVLYAPDLQLIGTVDNTNSPVATTYSKSVATGFSFSSTQSLSFKFGFEAGVVFAKASFSFTFSFSFTEQYSTTTTETVNFAVPAGQKAFLYQGTLRSRIIRYDPFKDKYEYKEESSFLSNIFSTFSEPIPNKPVTNVRQLDEVN
jgi:hypothetical protein